MQRDLKLYLWDIIRSGEEIQSFLSAVSLPEYEQNALVRRAVERSFEIIGEALAQARDQYPEIKAVVAGHQQIVNFRNRIIHGYFALDDRVVYSTAEEFLPGLLVQARSLLADLPE